MSSSYIAKLEKKQAQSLICFSAYILGKDILTDNWKATGILFSEHPDIIIFKEIFFKVNFPTV